MQNASSFKIVSSFLLLFLAFALVISSAEVTWGSALGLGLSLWLFTLTDRSSIVFDLRYGALFILPVIALLLLEAGLRDTTLRKAYAVPVLHTVWPSYNLARRFDFPPIEQRVYEDWYEWEAVTFDPRRNIPSLYEYIGMFITEDNSASDVRPLIEAWRTSKSPCPLYEADIQYLYIDSEWRSWLSDEETAVLSDPANYELVREWSDPSSVIQIYRVIPC